MTPLELLKNAPTPRTDHACVSPEWKNLVIGTAIKLERENAALREALLNWTKPDHWSQSGYAKAKQEARALLAVLEKE